MSLLKFVNLYGAWFFLALIPLIILYFLKLRRPKLEVPSLVLWQSVVNDQRVNSPFQKFRRNLLLLLQIILLCLVILAIMQPFLKSEAAVSEYVPILIDCSASMSSVDEVTGKSRLDLIREQVREQIENLTGNQQISLFSFAATGRRLTEFTNDRRALLKALEKVQPTDLPAQLDDVLRMAAAYTRSFPIQKVTVLTDGNLPERANFELPFELDVRRVDIGGPNIGITEMTARRSGPTEWEIFLRVLGSTDDLRGAELEIWENGEKTHSETIEVSLEEAERMVIPVAADKARFVEARLVPSGFDSMKTDNSVWLSLPAARPLSVWIAPKLGTWKRAASVLENLTVEEGDAEKPKGSDYDLIVADNAEVDSVNAAVKVFVGVVPPDLEGIVEVKDDVASVVDWNRTAPLLRHVQMADVQMGEQPAYLQGFGVKDIEDRGYEVLADGNAGPLLLQKREGLQVSWWFLFHTDKSTLPFRVGFPIIMANAVDASLKQASLSEIAAAPTGVLPAVTLQADRDYVVRTPDGGQIAARSNATGTLLGIPASRVGKYEILEGTEVVSALGTGLLNGNETALKVVEDLKVAEADVKAEEMGDLESDRPIWWPLAAAAFAVMLFEWWYFQRARGSAV